MNTLLSLRPRPPKDHLFTLWPSSRTAAGATIAAPIMLSIAETIDPTAEESRTVPGERKNDTIMIATSTVPAKTAVRPAVLASDAACLGAKPSSSASRKRVMIKSE